MGADPHHGGMPRTTAAVRLGHAAIMTPDLDRARRFFEDVLGLRTLVVEHPQGAPFRRLAVLTDAAAASAMLLLFEVPGYDSGLPDDLIGRRGRIDHLSFVVSDDAEFAVVVQRLVDAGASSGVVEELGPSRSVLFVDPDGSHHNLQVGLSRWQPAASTDVLDADLLRRSLGVTVE